MTADPPPSLALSLKLTTLNPGHIDPLFVARICSYFLGHHMYKNKPVKREQI